MRYSAFGEIRASTGTTVTDKKYTGQQQETEIGLDFYVARFYDPVTAHFVQPDSSISELGNIKDFDRYSYSRNNPINNLDPTGHRPTEVSDYPSWKATRNGTTIHLQVRLIQQPSPTSCGEASFSMVWNYQHVDKPVIVFDVVEKTKEKKYYTPDTPPYTSPNAMQNIAIEYLSQFNDLSNNNELFVKSGNVDINDKEAAKQFLISELQNGNPVVIDVSVYLGTPKTGDVHFIVITGYDPRTGEFIYNDPYGQGGKAKKGSETFDNIWLSWVGNSDGYYLGHGWYMVIY